MIHFRQTISLSCGSEELLFAAVGTLQDVDCGCLQIYNDSGKWNRFLNEKMEVLTRGLNFVYLSFVKNQLQNNERRKD